ncbi:hypothetical protein [Spiroplasma endosymbiont of Othius punctulatus]|uniref:hypothetical protein n=1 Tax=Spiroplasma endosymbiont of Othius punctulatus TaxID=3066289 RepID=UPI0030CAD889
MPKQAINFRDIEEKDKEEIFYLFKDENDHKIENTSYSMLGLNKLNEDKLYTRMINAGAQVIVASGKVVGIIEVVPYDEDALELRIAIIIGLRETIEEDEWSDVVDRYIIAILKKYGVKRIIMEVSKKGDKTITYLLDSGFRVISTINDSISLEFDYTKFNQ